MKIMIQRLPHAENIPLPTYATQGSAGMDVAAAIDTPITLNPMERTLVPSGFSMAIPEGYEIQIRPRSGLALKHGITVLNTPGTIDSDYRGEVKVLLINLGAEDFVIEPGMRIAQLIIANVTQTTLEEVETLEDSQTNRSPAGFGSTGLKDIIKAV